MRYRLFGRTGLRVSELCLGTMLFGRTESWGTPREDAARIVGAYAAAGGNFLDTANFYAAGESERIVGELVARERERWVVASKYTLSTRLDDPNAGGSHRKNLVQSLEASLRRLDMEYIDVYWVHVHDVFTPIEEVVRALDDQVRAGKILYVGISDTPAWIVSQAITLAELRGWTPFAGLQIPYSLVERTVERELLPAAKAFDLAVTTWSALGGGVLGGAHGSGRAAAAGTRVASLPAEEAAQTLSERNLLIADAVSDVAAAHGVHSSQIAIAWLLAQRERAAVIPIVGARTLEQTRRNIASLDVVLTEEDLALLDRASRVDPGFPHDFEAIGLAHGDTFSLVDDDR